MFYKIIEPLNKIKDNTDCKKYDDNKQIGADEFLNNIAINNFKHSKKSFLCKSNKIHRIKMRLSLNSQSKYAAFIVFTGILS